MERSFQMMLRKWLGERSLCTSLHILLFSKQRKNRGCEQDDKASVKKTPGMKKLK
jgi:hypothetical protein